MHTCFVIMPFGKTTEEHTQQYWADHFEYFIKPAIETSADQDRLLGYQAKLSDLAGGGIIADVFESLESAEIVLAEISDFNPNVMYELGIRHCLRDRTILIIEEGMPIPFYFQNYKVIQYSKKTPKDIIHFREIVQKRLIELNQDRINSSDNPVFDYFKGIGKRLVVMSREGITSVLQDLNDNGLLSLYVPSINAIRNVDKETALSEASEIKLLASTGHSYLAMVGNRFKGTLFKKLNSGLHVQIVIFNPWSVSGVLLALGELTDKNVIDDAQINSANRPQDVFTTKYDPVKVIENSIYFRRKYPESIEGYLDLKNRFGDRIQFRLCDYEIASTILLTGRKGFLEPYLHVNLSDRMTNSMMTFEVEFNSSSYLYLHSNSYFELLWQLSVPYETFLQTEELWKDKLRRRYELARPTSDSNAT